MQIRPVHHPDDLEDIRRLLAKCRLVDQHAPMGEHKYLDLMRDQPLTTGCVFEVENELIAYAHLSSKQADVDWVIEAAIHPEHRDPVVVKDVIQAAVDLTAEAGGGRVRLWVYLPSVAAVVEELGFTIERELLQMRLPLPPHHGPVPPTGLRVAPFRVGADEEAWIRVNNRAFAGHPENGSWTRSILADRLRQDWFDPEGFLLAWEGSGLAGFCWTKVHPGSLGEIYVIAVDPDYWGRSLGTWLTLEGLWYLHRRRKATSAMLYVDAANWSAVGMYERLGFELDHVDRSFVRPVEAAQPATGDPNTRAQEGHA